MIVNIFIANNKDCDAVRRLLEPTTRTVPELNAREQIFKKTFETFF